MHEGTMGSPLMWAGFAALVFALLFLDLAVFHRRAHAVRPAEALGWSIFWVSLAAAFCGWIYFEFGKTRALEFLTGYILEQSLSVDNLFVFIVLFQTFKVDSGAQHRVLFWGILGAMVFRAIFILLGAALINAFHGVLYIFGAILVFTAFKLLRHGDDDVHPEKNVLYRAMRFLVSRFVPVLPEHRGAAMFVRENGKLFATPLFLVLIAVETTDIVFAVDSVPAIFAVTTDPFIVYTSNIFAIMGLRALFFLLANVMQRFRYLKPGLAAVLAFIGVKMLVVDFYAIPISVSLAVIATIIGGSVVISMLLTRKEPPAPPAASS